MSDMVSAFPMLRVVEREPATVGCIGEGEHD